MTRIATAARPAVREEAASAEAFDAWASVPEWADLTALPACVFVPFPTPDMHRWYDTVRQWMECDCGAITTRDDW